MNALACTAPLHDLDAPKAHVQTAGFTAYQMSELALSSIELVTLAMPGRPGDYRDRHLSTAKAARVLGWNRAR